MFPAWVAANRQCRPEKDILILPLQSTSVSDDVREVLPLICSTLR